MGHDFRFEVIPLSEAVQETELEPADEAPVVLVVDDEPLIADTLAAILRYSGLCVLKAYNGATALELAMEHLPDLLLTDVAMPGLNGIDLAIAVVEALPACRILLFSAHASLLDLRRSKAAGFDFSLLPKPLHPRDMLRHVSEAIYGPPRVKTQRQFGQYPPAGRVAAAENQRLMQAPCIYADAPTISG